MGRILDNEQRMSDKTVLGITNFGIHLLKSAVKGPYNGIVAIPSVASVLAMTQLGAKENTALQIKNALTHKTSSESMECDNSNGEDDVDGALPLHPSTQMQTEMCTSVAETGESYQFQSRSNMPMRKVRKLLKKVGSFGEDSNNKWVIDDEEFHSQLGHLLGGYPDSPASTNTAGYILRNANRLYLKKNGSISKGFIGASEKLYNSKPEVMNFAGNPEKCRHEINTWVEKHTAHKIKDLIPPGSIEPDTSIIIVNAIYFKGDWEDKFDPDLTQKKPFTCLDGRQTETDMMFKSGDLYHKVDAERQCQVIELPYVNRDLSFLVILPDETCGLTKLEESLDATTLVDLTSHLREKEVLLYLPKFKIEVGLDLSGVLQSIGITDMFNPDTANLKGMDAKGLLYVSRIMHKAYIEVNEEGSEAAGATAEIVRAAGAPSRRQMFKADHAFVFLIRDNRNGAVLFMGRYCQP